jgi:hypothetical protein
MRDDIKQIAEVPRRTRSHVQRASRVSVRHIARRIDPLERALKEHLAAG